MVKVEDLNLLRGKLYIESVQVIDRKVQFNLLTEVTLNDFIFYIFDKSRNYIKLNHKFNHNKITIKLPKKEKLDNSLKGDCFFGLMHESYGNFIFEQLYMESKINTFESTFDLNITDINETSLINQNKFLEGISVNKLGALKYISRQEHKYKIITREAFRESIEIKDIKYNNSCLSLTISNHLNQLEKFKCILSDKKNQNRIVLIHTLVSNKIIDVNLPIETLNELANGQWQIRLEQINNDKYYQYNFVLDGDMKENSYIELCEENAVWFSRDKKGILKLFKGKSYNIFRYKNKLNPKLIALDKSSKKGYYFKVLLNNVIKIKYKYLALKLRNENIYKVIKSKDVQINTIHPNKIELKALINIDLSNIASIYWDLMIYVENSSGEDGYIRVNDTSEPLIEKVNSSYFSNAIYDNKNIFYPYISLENNVAFVARNREKYETKTTEIKKKCALILYKILKKSYFKNKKIWLAFEKFSKTAQDNAYAFYTYIRDNDYHKDFYYIIDKKEADKLMKKDKNILYFMSFKYMLYVFAADLIISSETKNHAFNIRVKNDVISQALLETKAIFLQHGVTAFKKSNVFKKQKGRGNFDLVVATSEMEKEIIRDNWKYNSDEIVTTGFSRWDLLINKADSNDVKRKIFMMPTWRSWMEGISVKEFLKSDYYNKYSTFLKSKTLQNILEINGVILVFFLHPKFKEYAGEFEIKSPNIIVKEFLDIKVNEELMEASLLISDYSSVTWDMFYMKKPVLFFQFDEDKYREKEGSYLNFERDLFGDRAFTVEELIEKVNWNIKNQFKLKTEYESLYSKYFEHKDLNNSARIYKEIKKRYE